MLVNFISFFHLKKYILSLSSFMYIPNCLVDCKWTSWSNCSESCGVGTKTREIDVTAKHDSQNCTGNDTDSCNIKECPGQSIINTIVSFLSLPVRLGSSEASKNRDYSFFLSFSSFFPIFRPYCSFSPI